MNKPLAHGLLLAAGAIWGAGFVAQKSAMADLGPMFFIGCRFLLAAVVFSPLAWREWQRAPRRPSRANGRQFLLLGAVFFAGAGLQQTGLQGTTITNTGFLTGLYVILVPFILQIGFRESPSRFVWPLACCSLLGIWLLQDGNLTQLGFGDGLILTGAIFWALHVILVSRLAVQTGLPLTMATAQFLIAGILGWIVACGQVVFGSANIPNLAAFQAALPEILYTGIISGGLAFTLQATAQRHTKAGVAAILMSSEALFSALFGALLLGERLSLSGYTGCGLIFTTIIATELVSLKRTRAGGLD